MLVEALTLTVIVTRASPYDGYTGFDTRLTHDKSDWCTIYPLALILSGNKKHTIYPLPPIHLLCATLYHSPAFALSVSADEMTSWQKETYQSRFIQNEILH